MPDDVTREAVRSKLAAVVHETLRRPKMVRVSNYQEALIDLSCEIADAVLERFVVLPKPKE